jgi:hypothetical protein
MLIDDLFSSLAVIRTNRPAKTALGAFLAMSPES